MILNKNIPETFGDAPVSGMFYFLLPSDITEAFYLFIGVFVGYFSHFHCAYF